MIIITKLYKIISLKVCYYIINLLERLIYYSIITIVIYIFICFITLLFFTYNPDIFYYNLPIYYLNDYSDSSVKNTHILEYIDSRLRRRFFWEIVESNRDNYNSYKDFKDNWDNDTKIYLELKKEVKNDLHKINIFKKTLFSLASRLNPKNT